MTGARRRMRSWLGGSAPHQRLRHLGGGEPREAGADQRRHPGGQRRRHVRASEAVVAAARRGRREAGSGGGQCHVGARAREWRQPAVLRGGADRDDPWVGRRVVDRPRARAVVPGGRDERHAAAERVADRRALRRAAARRRGVAGGGGPERARVQRQGDHAGAVGDGVPDPGGDGGGQPAGDRGAGVQRVVVLERYPDRQDPRARGDPGDADGAVGAVTVTRRSGRPPPCPRSPRTDRGRRARKRCNRVRPSRLLTGSLWGRVRRRWTAPRR